MQRLRLRKTPTLFAVPTTAGSGAEATPAAMIANPETHVKYAVLSPGLRPKYAVLDPALTLGLPPRLTAQTGMNALAQAVEAYISRGRTKRTDALAREAVELVFANLDAACSNGGDMEARDAMLYAAFRAGTACARAYAGYAHGIALALGGLYGLPHGLASAVALPHVLTAYGPCVHARLADLYDAAGFSPLESDAEKAEAFIRTLRVMNTSLGIPGRFERIKEKDVPEIAGRCIKECNPLYAVPRIWRREACEGVVRRIKEGA